MKINVKTRDFEILEKLEVAIAAKLRDLQLKYAEGTGTIDPEDAGATYAFTEMLGLIEDVRYGE